MFAEEALVEALLESLTEHNVLLVTKTSWWNNSENNLHDKNNKNNKHGSQSRICDTRNKFTFAKKLVSD